MFLIQLVLSLPVLLFSSRLMCLGRSLSASSLHFFAWHVQSTPNFLVLMSVKHVNSCYRPFCGPNTVVGVLCSLRVCVHTITVERIFGLQVLFRPWLDQVSDCSESLNSKAESQRLKLGKKLVPAIRRKWKNKRVYVTPAAFWICTASWRLW